jgi:hypothetical protein
MPAPTTPIASLHGYTLFARDWISTNGWRGLKLDRIDEDFHRRGRRQKRNWWFGLEPGRALRKRFN